VSRYSDVAASNRSPGFEAKRAGRPDHDAFTDNRLIAWPYTKIDVAITTVTMGGAADDHSWRAREPPHREEHMIYVHGGASAEQASALSDRGPVYGKPRTERRA